MDVLNRMVSVLEHRGPDDSGTYHSRTDQSDGSGVSNGPGAALGHRRLSIIDLQTGHQPLANEDNTVWIVFNGEIYNYRELRSKLESLGHQFRTAADTETIVHAWEEYGPDCVAHLRGMFAFAIWDAKQRRLFLARDRLGQKPLFYRLEQNRLLFASELKALLQVPGLPRELDPYAVDEFLTYQYVAHPRCILKGFNKLPPGCWAVYENGTLKVERYWTPPFAERRSEVATETADRFGRIQAEGGSGLTRNQKSEGGTWSAAQWQNVLRETLTEAVRLRMRSDVPLGAFLSGGVDSTIIAGLMQQISDRPVHTFSIGFPVKKFDETSYAREAAQFLGTEHHEYLVEPSALEMLPKLIWHYDEPFADSSAIPMIYLSQVTRQEVTVSLSGDGGDELFAGYDRYRAVQLGAMFDRLPGPLQKLLTAKIWQKLPAAVEQRTFRRRLKRLLSALGEPPERRYLRWISIMDDERRRSIYTDDFREQLGSFDSAKFILDAYRQCPDRDFVTRTTCVDMLTYLPCDILTKVDIAGMAYGLECRSPFLDHHVAELAARMPMGLKRKRTRGKQILIETFSDLLPASIQKRSKMGFGVPLDHWFRNELKPLLYDTLLDSQTLNRGFFKPEAIRKLVEEHTTEKWDHSYRLWALLCLELWQRMFLETTAVPSKCPTSI
jgi:asparagine synthase (glutamine-hydrolysing)